MATESSENLTMASATYARNSKGQKDLISELKSAIDKLTTKISAYETVLNQVSNNWVGDDATRFKKVIKDNATSINKQLSTLKSKYETALSTDYKGFTKTQTDNKNLINTKKVTIYK
jgi:uncharacterized protein YukE